MLRRIIQQYFKRQCLYLKKYDLFNGAKTVNDDVYAHFVHSSLLFHPLQSHEGQLHIYYGSQKLLPLSKNSQKLMFFKRSEKTIIFSPTQKVSKMNSCFTPHLIF